MPIDFDFGALNTMARHPSFRLRCGDLNQISFDKLQREGFLRPGRQTILSWASGSEIGLDAREHGLTFRYRVNGGGDTVQHVWLTTTPTNFGGKRRWFECPGCKRPCGVLFMRGRFECRICLGLSYVSQVEAPHWRLFSKARTIRRRLGGTGSLQDAFPRKPRHMHWKTYRRLEHQCLAIEGNAAAGMMAGLAAKRDRAQGTV